VPVDLGVAEGHLDRGVYLVPQGIKDHLEPKVTEESLDLLAHLDWMEIKVLGVIMAIQGIKEPRDQKVPKEKWVKELKMV
jgi:hypothetical protein